MKSKIHFFFILVLWLILPLATAGSGVTQAKSMGDRLRVGDDSQIGPTFTVNTTEDSDDVCTISHCSLREAINAANAQAGPNSIIFAPAAYGTISPATALPIIIDDLVIGGPGVGYLILNGALVTHHSLLRVNSGSLYLSGFTVWQGGSNMNPAGGALLATGTSQVSLNSMRFNENRAQFGGALALYNGATLNHVEFYGNQAMAGDGGAIVAFNDTVTIHNTSFNSNSASDRGGAIYMMGNFLNIYTSEFGDNTAVNGGAIYAEARPTIDRSRFLGNQATT
ncbi:MAG: CSLREA domain-containing protein, partial [Chloroflexota bacterium]